MHEALGELTVEMIEEIWEIFAFWGAHFADQSRNCQRIGDKDFVCH